MFAHRYGYPTSDRGSITAFANTSRSGWRHSAILAVVVFLAAPTALAAPPADTPSGQPEAVPAAEKEPVTLDGKWKVVDGEIGGVEGVGPLKEKVWTFAKGKLNAEIAGDPKNPGKKFLHEYDYEIDPEKEPKQMVMTLFDEVGEEVVNRAIYALEEGTLKICWTFNPRPDIKLPFPEAFRSLKGDPNSMLLIFERIAENE